MTRLGLAHPWRSVWVVLLNLVITLAGLIALSLAGLSVDVVRSVIDPAAPLPRRFFGWSMPHDWMNYRGVVVIGVGLIFFAVARTFLRYYTAIVTARFIQNIMVALRRQVYDKLQRLSFRFFDSNETGSIINRATSDCGAVSAFAEMAMVQSLSLVINLVLMFAYMWSIHPVLATVGGIATTPLLLIASIVYSRAVRPTLVENRNMYDRLILTLSENIQAQHVVKGFSREEEEIAKFRLRNDDYRVQQRRMFRLTAAYTVISSILTQVNLIVVLGLGGYIVIAHAGEPQPPMTVGSLIVFASLLQQFSAQVLGISGMASTLQSSLTSAGRVLEVLNSRPEIESKPGALCLPRAHGEIEFHDVGFSYKTGDRVLDGVSLKVEPGMCVAVLGATGAGKSTLLSLIPRFYDPTQGHITLDGIDLRDLDLDDLRRNVGLVFQENFLFSNTVRSNIAFGNPDATHEQVEKAATIAAAHGFIKELPQGYDTVISEQGASLSGGQRQRLAIARAILLEPPVLLLDDATAAIDPETEHEILQAMDNAMRGRTTFVVAHRLSTLRRADYVIVLENGRIVQKGTHDELIRRGGLYRTVASLQVVDAESKRIIRARQWAEGLVDSPLVPPGDEP
ncbi:MAG: ABC transporter ATP-binding protein/permease [Planctomycetes bacterium]|nr:ABC transporter ATP-binding protein/permease [Planctomycetota bacterium]